MNKQKKWWIGIIMTIIVFVGGGLIFFQVGGRLIPDVGTYQNKVQMLLGQINQTGQKWQYALGGEPLENGGGTSGHSSDRDVELPYTSSAGGAHNNGAIGAKPDAKDPARIKPEPDKSIDKPIDLKPGNGGEISIQDLCTPLYAAKFRALGKEFLATSKTFDNYVILENAKIDAPTYEGHQAYFDVYKQIGENLILFADEIDKGNIDAGLTYLDTLIELNQSVPKLY
ncbi:MAG: hypothetical protein ACRC6X_02385 [Culicoidibacterales bacterium]